MELKRDAINFTKLARFANINCGRNERYVTAANASANATAHGSLWSGGQVGAELECGAPAHCRTSHDIFRCSFCKEMLRRDNRHLAGFHIGFVDDPAHPTKMVAMAVAIDNSRDWSGA